MPTAKRYGAQQVGVDPLRGGQKTAAATATSEGAGLEAARAQVGESIAAFGTQAARLGIAAFTNIQKQERARADEVALLNAQNQLDAWEITRLHDPETGAYNIKGKDSFTLPETIDADFQKVTSEIDKGLATPEQRIAFAKIKSNRAANVAVGVRRHVAGEMRQYEAQELDATLNNAINLASANSQDPRRIGEEIARGETAINQMATRQGVSPEAKQRQLETFRSGAHLGVINNLLAQEQDKAAAIYYSEAKDQIEGTRRDEIEKALKLGGTKREAFKLADDILAEGGTLTEQRDKARKIEDPDTRQMVEQRLEHQDAVNDKAKRDAEKADTLKATNLVERGGFGAIPADLLSRLEPGLRSSLFHYSIAKAKGIPVETNPSVLYGYMRMAAKEPQKFIETNLLENIDKLSESDLQRLSGLQLSLEQGKQAAAEKELGGFRARQEIVDNTLTQYGIESRPGQQSAGEKNAVAQLQRMLDRRIEAEQAATGKKVTNAQIQTLLDDLLSQGADVPGSWQALYNPIRYDWSGQRKRLVDQTIDDVPPDKRKQIEQGLRLKHRPVTDATILDTWIEMQVR